MYGARYAMAFDNWSKQFITSNVKWIRSPLDALQIVCHYSHRFLSVECAPRNLRLCVSPHKYALVTVIVNEQYGTDIQSKYCHYFYWNFRTNTNTHRYVPMQYNGHTYVCYCFIKMRKTFRHFHRRPTLFLFRPIVILHTMLIKCTAFIQQLAITMLSIGLFIVVEYCFESQSWSSKWHILFIETMSLH